MKLAERTGISPLRLALAAGSLALLAGCASTPGSCDASNSEASLLAKMNCEHSGGYSEQVRQREQALADARAENAAFHQVYEQLMAEQQALGQSLGEQQQRQQQLDASLGQLLAQLKRRHASKAEVQQQIGALEQQMQANRQLPPSNDPAVLEARKAELKALQQKVSRLQFSLGYE